MRSSKFQLNAVAWLFVFCVLAALPVGLALARPRADTTVGGPIVSDTVWTAANSPYIVTSNINVLSGVTLTVQAGTIVKFNAGYKLQVIGQLIVNGTSEAPVVFTSNQATPAPGDWDRIEFTSSAVTSTIGSNGEYLSGSLLRGCVVEYAGLLAYGGGTAVELNGTLMDGCTVRKSQDLGIYASNGSGTPSWIVGSTISDNNRGVFLHSSVLMSSTVLNNTHDGVGYGVGVAASQSRVLNNLIANNRGNSGGAGLGASGGVVSGNVIRGNVISRTSGYCQPGAGAGLYVDPYGDDDLIEISNNIIADNVNSCGNGGGAYLGSQRATTFINNTVINNQVTHTSAQGAGVYIASPNPYYQYYNYQANIQYNTFVGNTGPADSTTGALATVGGSLVQIHFNTIYGNSPYDAAAIGGGGGVVSGTQNYWGTSNTTNILKQIYDFYDNSNLSEFKFIPYLSQPDPAAPVSPPLNLALQSQPNGALKISWDANPSFATGWGYKVYYGNSSTPPFNGIGQPAGNSPIDVGSNTNIVLSAPLPKFVTVTAYDTQGHESWYASALSTAISYKVFLPLVLR